MQWLRALPYTLPLLYSGIVLLGLAIYIWRRRRAPGAYALLALAAGAAIWSLGYALEIALAASPAALLWARFQYLGIMTLPVAWLAFALSYSGQAQRLRPTLLATLLAVPLITNVLVWTNDLHGLIWPAIRLDTSGPIPILSFAHGPAFWACNLYSHALLLGGTLIIASSFLRSPRIYVRQILAMVLAVVAPWLGNIIYVLRLSPLPELDLTPFAFVIAVFAVTFGVWRYRFLDLVPVARGHLFEQLDDCIIVLDFQQRVIDWNAAARRFLGQSDPTVGGPLAAALETAPLLFQYLSPPQAGHAEVQVDAHRTLDVRVTQLDSVAGARSGWLVIWRDISARKDAEVALQRQNQMLLALQSELIQARDAAEAANRAKSIFLANMSHELRTPLAAILGYAQLMQLELERRADTTLQRDIQATLTAGQHLLSLINALLDLTRLEAGKLELQHSDFMLTDLIDSVIDATRPVIARNNNTLQLNIPVAPITLSSDATKLRQILINLLGNAAKFTENGLIELRAFVAAPAHAADITLVVEVADTGIGIAEADRATLFDSFTQARGLAGQLNEGTGLGLNLSLGLARLLGGDISVTSVVDRGSTFTLTIPCRLGHS